MRWPWSKREAPEPSVPTDLTSITDPSIAAYFVPGWTSDGMVIGEHSALTVSALYRGVSLISGTLASLKMATYRDENTERRQVPSVFDDPDGPDGQTPFEWKETLLLHLLLHGRAGAIKQYNGAGAITRLALAHPLSWRAEQPTEEEYANPEKMPRGGLWFVVTLNDGTQVRLDSTSFWYVPAMSSEPGCTYGILGLAREDLGAGLAGAKATRRAFSNGGQLTGLVTPDDEQDIVDDVPEIRRQVTNAITGAGDNAGFAIIARRLKFTPWSMSAQQAQFIESQQFNIEQISRWTGVPPHLLMQTEKQTSWGTGVDEQNRGLSKFVLGHWAKRIEERATRALAPSRPDARRERWVEFEFASLERPNFAVEIDLLLKQTGKPILTVNEARKIRNLSPIEGGDTLEAPAAIPAPADDESEQESADA